MTDVEQTTMENVTVLLAYVNNTITLKEAKKRHREGKSTAVRIELSLENGWFHVSWVDHWEAGVSEDRWHGRTLAWTLPAVSNADMWKLLRELQPIAQELVEHSRIELNRDHNRVGRRDEIGDACAQKIADTIARFSDRVTR